MNWWRCWIRLVLALPLVPGVAAQTQTAPSFALSVDQSRYHFKTPEDEVSARAELNTALQQMGRFKGQINSAAQLLDALRSYDAVRRLFAKHEAYLHLRCSLDRKDRACDADHALESEVKAKTAFLDLEILAISEDRLSGFLSEEAGLAQYRFALGDIRRDPQHQLPEPEQSLLDQLQPQIADWQYDLYEQVVGSIVFGTVQTPTGPLDVIRQRNLIATNRDGRVREEGFKKRYAGFAGQRDFLAFALIHLVQAQSALAKAHHYADAPARKYESLYFKPEETRSLLARMAQHEDIPKRYEKVLSEDVEREYRQPAHV